MDVLGYPLESVWIAHVLLGLDDVAELRERDSTVFDGVDPAADSETFPVKSNGLNIEHESELTRGHFAASRNAAAISSSNVAHVPTSVVDNLPD